MTLPLLLSPSPRLPLFLSPLFLLLFTFALTAQAETDGKVQILLLGDSTCQGSVPIAHDPAAPHHEDIVRTKLAEEKDLPPTHVINLGRNGETLEGLLKRYDKDVATIPGADYVLIRYGINDRAKRQDFPVNFPKDFHDLIARLRQTFPKAVIIPMTIIPFSSQATSDQVNGLVKQVAAEEKLAVFDIFPLYDAALKRFGQNSLNYRRFPLDKIPEADREFVKPYVTGTPPMVEVMDDKLDAKFDKLPGWYGDRHPNAAGYQVIGEETAKYLAPLMRKPRG